MFTKTTLQRFSSALPLTLRRKIIQVVPNIVRPAVNLLPIALQKKIILPALHSVFNEAIAEGDFDFLQHKWLKISITDLNLNWLISYDNNQLVMANNTSQVEEDVSFSATGDDLLLIAGRKQDPDTLFFQRRLKIEGDTELGLEVKNLIDAIELEKLPRSVHSIVQCCADWLSETQSELTKAST
jgi:predicted lipid carrier protein YhbT